MTTAKKPMINIDPKTVEAWDSEGGAPASGDRSTRPAKSVADSHNDPANNQSISDIEVRKVEEHANGQFLYSICLRTPGGIVEIPVKVHVEGAAAQNEEAALQSALLIIKDLISLIRRSLTLSNSAGK